MSKNKAGVLLIRGFGVRVPGGAPTIKALAWWFTPGRGLFSGLLLGLWVGVDHLLGSWGRWPPRLSMARAMR
ncbi:hypothetical protein M2302_003064, partial [Micromonospora sp. A200]|uniref:hypothetical protein n=1 Tax=Micromonospora sp. A200 TaxID=2940568 RepID=UPI0024767866